MDEKKVKEAIEDFKELSIQMRELGLSGACEQCDLAIEALEKQLPKEIKAIDPERSEEFGDVEFCCPNCNSHYLCDIADVFKFDFNRVKSFDCQCGRHYVNTYNGGWIPVEERLPEEGTYVMCCFDDGAVDVLWQNWQEDKSLLFYADIDNEIRKAIAWQPLPEPYKGGKE